jgi:NAD+ synthase (glutamine-hydrolysing)
MGAEIIINISASPYNEGRLVERRNLIQDKVKEMGIPFIYCNMVGAQDELIFDGESLVFSANGDCVGQGEAFTEDLILVDIESPQSKEIKVQPKEEKMFRALSLGVSDYFIKTGHKEAVLGLSGGIDSALVAVIATDALGSENVHGISLPSKYSSDHSLSDAQELANNLGIDYRIIPIQEAVEGLETVLHPHFLGMELNVAEENIQARARGNLLMALSNKFGWMVLSTGNKTELALGYCTLYGDMSGGLSVISDLSKSDVYVLAKWVNSQNAGRIPHGSISKPPSAELAPDQVDPFDYEVVSPLVDAIVEDRKSPAELIKDGANMELVNSLYQKIRINEYKRRQAAPGLRVSSKAFGVGRRFPIVNHYKGKEK